MHSPEYEVNWVDANLPTTQAQYYYDYYNNHSSTTNVLSNTNDGVYYNENPYQNEVPSYETYNLKKPESIFDEHGNYKESGYYSETQNGIIVVNEYPDNQKNIAKPPRNQTCLNDLSPVSKSDSLYCKESETSPDAKPDQHS